MLANCQIVSIIRIVTKILMSLIFPCRWFLTHVPLLRVLSALVMLDKLDLIASRHVSGDIDEDKIEPLLLCNGCFCLERRGSSAGTQLW